MNKKVAFSFVGVISIILGIVCFFLDVGRTVDFNTYGGDAYTGIQHASATTANNIRHLSEIVKCGFGFVLIIAGLVLIMIAITAEKANKPSQAIMKETGDSTIVSNTTPVANEQNDDLEEISKSEIDYVGTIKEIQKKFEKGEITKEEMKKRIESI